ncbi:hypothetical protein OD350_28810 (plasmid) [Clostridium beijerinckii]|uniref:hypothetical protein n=1 Tax=Clostridium beijerinckii TaxID=1520 RepID=UPI002227C15A|nr:hypothetical protein [Clostridium beijerinckii]UYZ39076.1 hypothetical protein OD350_28810 [Clostridium beijerinckii]
MINIERLIEEYEWNMSVWGSRYGGGFWIALALDDDEILSDLEDISRGSDREAIELEMYINNEGKWLPIEISDTLEDGFKKLNEKLKNNLNNVEYRNAVYNAYKKIIELNEGCWGLEDAVEQKTEKALFWNAS